MKKVVYFLSETIFMAVDVSGEEIMKIFSKLGEVLHPTGIWNASRFTSGHPVFWSSNKLDFCSNYIIMMYYIL